MKEIQGSWPVRSTTQRLWTVLRVSLVCLSSFLFFLWAKLNSLLGFIFNFLDFLSKSKAFVFKFVVDTPCLYGLVETFCTSLGLNFDRLIVAGVRGFAKLEYVRQRPSLGLLESLLHRLHGQHMACFEDSSLQSSVARRRRVARIVLERLEEEGIEVISHGDGTNAWWLLPILCPQAPQDMAKALLSYGFDATNTSTQLQRVAAAATCKSAAVRPSDGKDRAILQVLLVRSITKGKILGPVFEV